jgi:hypothetical protein
MNLKLSFSVIIIALILPCLSFSGPYDIEPGHWANVSLNTIDDIDPCPARDCSYSAVSGVRCVIGCWCGGAFATKFGTLGGLIVWGGGHNGYFGNEIYIFNLGTQLWERYTEPVKNPSCNQSTGELQDGSPCSAHTYDYLDYHPATNSFIALGSTSNHQVGGGGAPRVHLFSFDTDTWRRGADRPSSGGMTGASSAYDPNRDVFWLLPAWNGTYEDFAKYNPNANSGAGQWTLYNEYIISIDAVSAVDPINDLFVTIDSRGTQTIRVMDLANPSADYVTVNTTGDQQPENRPKPGFEWDPVSSKFVAWIGGTSVYTLTPPASNWQTADWVWTKVDAAPANTVTPTSPNSNGTYSKWRYVPSKNIFIIINRTSDDVYVYKLTSDSGPAHEPVSHNQYGPVIECRPNPFGPAARIPYNLGPGRQGMMTIYDIRGKVVFKRTVQGAGTVLWNAEGLVNGLYLLKVSAGRKRYSRKLVLQQ